MGAGRAPPCLSFRGRSTESSFQPTPHRRCFTIGRARAPYLRAALAPFLPQRPHPLRGRRWGAARLRCAVAAGGTARQQRLLQVPGAPAATAPRWLLRWNPAVPPRAFNSSAAQVLPRQVSLEKRA